MPWLVSRKNRLPTTTIMCYGAARDVFPLRPSGSWEVLMKNEYFAAQMYCTDKSVDDATGTVTLTYNGKTYRFRLKVDGRPYTTDCLTLERNYVRTYLETREEVRASRLSSELTEDDLATVMAVARIDLGDERGSDVVARLTRHARNKCRTVRECLRSVGNVLLVNDEPVLRAVRDDEDPAYVASVSVELLLPRDHPYESRVIMLRRFLAWRRAKTSDILTCLILDPICYSSARVVESRGCLARANCIDALRRRVKNDSSNISDHNIVFYATDTGETYGYDVNLLRALLATTHVDPFSRGRGQEGRPFDAKFVEYFKCLYSDYAQNYYPEIETLASMHDYEHVVPDRLMEQLDDEALVDFLRDHINRISDAVSTSRPENVGRGEDDAGAGGGGGGGSGGGGQRRYSIAEGCGEPARIRRGRVRTSGKKKKTECSNKK